MGSVPPRVLQGEGLCLGTLINNGYYYYQTYFWYSHIMTELDSQRILFACNQTRLLLA